MAVIHHNLNMENSHLMANTTNNPSTASSHNTANNHLTLNINNHPTDKQTNRPTPPAANPTTLTTVPASLVLKVQ
jgi:hypothetical protein